MGVRNYLVEGVSGTGKTAVCHELVRRGYHAINGDRELPTRATPRPGEPLGGASHEHHLWHVDRVRALVADQRDAVTFFCGGSRNFDRFIDLFDEVFVLDVDRATLERRLDQRPPGEWGAEPAERDLVLRLTGRRRTSRAPASSSTRPGRSPMSSTRSSPCRSEGDDGGGRFGAL